MGAKAADVVDVSIPGDGSFVVAADQSGGIGLIDPDDQRVIDTLGAETGPVNAIAISPDGEFMAVGGDEGIRLWDPHTGEPLSGVLTQRPAPAPPEFEGIPASFLPPPRAVYGLAVSPDGSTLAAGMGDGSVRRWDMAQMTAVVPPGTGHVFEVWDVAFSPEGDRFASVGLGETETGIRVWDTETGEPLGSGSTGPDQTSPFTLAFSPDGSEIFVGGDSPMIVSLDAQTLALTDHVIPAQDRVADIAISPDGRLLASVGDGGIVRLWDLQNDKLLTELPGHRASVIRVAFSPDGAFLASGSADGTVRIWDRLLWSDDLDAFENRFCHQVDRSLTEQEWRTFASGVPPHATCGV